MSLLSLFLLLLVCFHVHNEAYTPALLVHIISRV